MTRTMIWIAIITLISFGVPFVLAKCPAIWSGIKRILHFITYSNFSGGMTWIVFSLIILSFFFGGLPAVGFLFALFTVLSLFDRINAAAGGR